MLISVDNLSLNLTPIEFSFPFNLHIFCLSCIFCRDPLYSESRRVEIIIVFHSQDENIDLCLQSTVQQELDQHCSDCIGVGKPQYTNPHSDINMMVNSQISSIVAISQRLISVMIPIEIEKGLRIKINIYIKLKS